MKERVKHYLTLIGFLALMTVILLLFHDFMEKYSSALMVLITFVYVVATVEICRANIKSAEATRDQVNESKRQFEETQRLQVMPFLQLSFTDSADPDPVPCAFIEMRTNKEECATTQVLFSLKNIGLGIAHHTKITVTTRYKKDDGYPAFDIVMPPNCEKSTYVRFNVEKYSGDLCRKEDICIRIKYDDILGNTYIQEANLVMIVREEGASLLHVVDMKSPQLALKGAETENA